MNEIRQATQGKQPAEGLLSQVFCKETSDETMNTRDFAPMDIVPVRIKEHFHTVQKLLLIKTAICRSTCWGQSPQDFIVKFGVPLRNTPNR